MFVAGMPRKKKENSMPDKEELEEVFNAEKKEKKASDRRSNNDSMKNINDAVESVEKEVIEIPIGKFLNGFNMNKMRENPWILSTLVLGIVLISFLVFGGGSGGVSKDTAGQNLLDFINAQGNGEASLVSVDKEGSLYSVVVNYQGQDIPVYVTLDGKNLVTDVVPLSSAEGSDTGGDTGGVVTIDETKIANAPVKGNVDAPVTIVEFSDYECPFCGKFYSESFQDIKKNYIDTGKVKLIYMDFPLTQIHPEAQKAAESARCVGEQRGDDGYFLMHDKLFENQQSLSIENYKKWARELGVNGAEFDSCLDDGKYASDVQADANYGATLGVSGTPAFFINGASVSGAQPYSVFEQIIESQLV